MTTFLLPLGPICYPGDIVKGNNWIGVVTDIFVDHLTGLEDWYTIYVPETQKTIKRVCWDVLIVPYQESSEHLQLLSRGVKQLCVMENDTNRLKG